jgi:hypothetical protein
LTIALVNDFSWVATGKQGNEDQAGETGKKDAAEKETESVATSRPGPCQGVKVILRGQPQPKRITNLVDGRTLTARNVGDTLEIALADFPITAVLQLDF